MSQGRGGGRLLAGYFCPTVSLILSRDFFVFSNEDGTHSLRGGDIF